MIKKTPGLRKWNKFGLKTVDNKWAHFMVVEKQLYKTQGCRGFVM
jgi:hypothetical protein